MKMHVTQSGTQSRTTALARQGRSPWEQVRLVLGEGSVG